MYTVWISLKSLCSKVLVTFADRLSAFFAYSDELSVNKRDTDGFFSKRIVGRSSNRSYNSNDSSLNIPKLSASLTRLVY